MQAAEEGARQVRALYARRLKFNVVAHQGRKLCLQEVARENARTGGAAYPQFQRTLDALYWSCVEDVAHRTKHARRRRSAAST